jgi:hypothetical protein
MAPRTFGDPIPLPRGRRLVTLKDAAAYILKLPQSQQQSPEWQAAAEVVIMAAEDRGPLMHAHVGMLRALFNPWRKDRSRLGQAATGAGRIARDVCPSRNSVFVPLMEQQF